MGRRRRLPRMLLNVATAVSLVLCAATVVLWVRSTRVADDWGVDVVKTFDDHPLHHANENVRYAIVTNSGTLTVMRRRGVFGFPPPLLATLPRHSGERRWTWKTAPAGPMGVRAFSTTHDYFFHQGSVDAVDAVSIPLWLCLAALAALPAARVSPALLPPRRAARRGFCARCGYDLRATPDRCPECGSARSEEGA